MSDSWLRSVVIDGVQRLYALSLPGSPAADIVKLTAGAWFDAFASAPIAWDRTQDEPRIRAAFMAASRTAERWPSPRYVLDRMPPRAQARALPPPSRTGPSPEVRRRLAALAGKLRWDGGSAC